jgi:tRNA(Ile)-lysidine synthetase-like protein
VFPLYVRYRENGDKMALKVGTKKVKDILIDQKIPLILRDRLLMIADENNIVWIPGIKKSYQDKDCKNKIYIYEVE